MQLFLIGFMGSGKTTTGKQLAQQLGLPFIDSDQWIEERTGKDLPAIFNEEGEIRFRELEKEFVRSLVDIPTVIACGGGLPCFNNLIDLLKQKGKVIYLEASVATLLQHLQKEHSVRPLLNGISEEELPVVISQRLEARKSVYELADFQLSTDGKTIEVIVAEILTILK